MHHLVRLGTLGHVGRFRADDGTRYPRGSRVICRTARGLEVGEVLAAQQLIGANPNEPDDEPDDEPRDKSPADCEGDGRVVRATTAEDELLVARLRRHQESAFQACQELLVERSVSAVLMDVEHLFDGRGLYFYFLGEVTEELDALTPELAELYDSEVQFKRFADTLTQGCGPDCGTEEGSGCGDACSTCAVVAACGQPAASEPAASEPAGEDNADPPPTAQAPV